MSGFGGRREHRFSKIWGFTIDYTTGNRFGIGDSCSVYRLWNTCLLPVSKNHADKKRKCKGCERMNKFVLQSSIFPFWLRIIWYWEFKVFITETQEIARVLSVRHFHKKRIGGDLAVNVDDKAFTERFDFREPSPGAKTINSFSVFSKTSLQIRVNYI